MSRSVEEGYLAAVGKPYVICSDVLRNAACLTCNDVGIADVVEQRSLSVVHMSHHSNNGGARHEVVLVVVLLGYRLRHFCTDILCLEAEFVCNKVYRLGVKALVDRHHDAHAHTCTDYLVHRNVHHVGEFAYRNILGKLQYLALGTFLGPLLLKHFLHRLALFLTIFGAFLVLVLACKTCQCLFYLACNVFFVHLKRLVVLLAVFLLARRRVGCRLGRVGVSAVLLCRRVYVHALFCYACALFLFTAVSLCVFLLTLFAALLLCLFLRAGALVD